MAHWQWPCIDLDNGSAPNRWQAIICTNAGRIHWRIYAALEGDELTHLTTKTMKVCCHIYTSVIWVIIDLGNYL